MNKAKIAAMLLASTTWLYPIKVAAKVETHVEVSQPSQDYTSGPLVIKDNAIQPTPLQPVLEKDPIRSNDKQLVRLNTPTTHANLYDGLVYTKEEVIQLIKDYSAQYGIDPEVPLRIANCESGYNQFSKNKSSSASGVFQYLSGTWAGTDESRKGLSVWDADANVRAAIKYMAIHKSTRPWVCK